MNKNRNCILCNRDILRDVKKSKKGNFLKGSLKLFHKEILNNEVKIKPKMCYDCAEKAIGHKIVRSLSRKEREIIYDVPYEQTKGMRKNGTH